MRAGKDAEVQRQEIRRRMDLVFQREHITRAELGARTGAASATVSEWFTKQAIPDGITLARIAQALNVNAHWLLTGEGPMAPPGHGERGVEDVFRAGAQAVIGRLDELVTELHADFDEASATQRAARLAQVRQDAEQARQGHGRRRAARRRAS
ncbi:MAG TPA: helix-turn-helix domain-containing protein [Gemmatimonadales bacterium]|nr:helix-turn-helix domain-containing protein [Gemmatimonadales bacterium]